MGDEPEGFRDFVLACSPRLLRTAWMLTGDAATAEDLLQTALARTWPHWDKVASGRPEAYVRTVMVRTNSSWRSRYWSRESPTAELPTAADRLAPAVGESNRVEDRLVLAAVLASLPRRQRQAVVLRFFDDLSVEAVAEIMGCAPGTVKSQSAKALAKLRETFAAPEKIEVEHQ